MFRFLLPSHFLTNKFQLFVDTESYTNVQGLSNGFGLSNFSSYLRSPGYPLFLFFTSLGKIPHPNTIAYVLCGNSVWGANISCDTASSKLTSDITVRMDPNPVVFGYSAATARLFQRTIEISRILFILSTVTLFIAISRDLGGIPSAVCVLTIVYFLFFKDQRSMDVLGTESLFPTIFFFYFSTFLEYLRSRRLIWLCTATALIIYAFFVRPAYIYMPVLHLVATIVTAINYKKWQHFILSTAMMAAAFVWLLLYSPVLFFSVGSHDAALLRTAVLADQGTVDCVANPAERALLQAYVNTNEDALKSAGIDSAATNYVQRYYALGNVYRIYLKTDPIYRQPSIEHILINGSIPDGLISGMLDSAAHCDGWRNFIFSAINFAMMTGLTPVLTPFAPHYFFQSPYVFWLSATCILLVIAWSLAANNGRWLFLSAMPSALYFGTIVVVALEQGGEARYYSAVEPLYVLSAITSFFFVTGEAGRIVQQRWPNTLTAVAARATFVTGGSGGAGFMPRSRNTLTLLITCFMLFVVCGYYFVVSPLFPLVPAPVKERDQQRMTDMQNLKGALSAYYEEHRSYPAAPVGDCPGKPPYDNLAGLASILVPKDIKVIPKDPRPASCVYNYMYFSDGKNYAIMARPEAIDPGVYNDRWCIGADSGSGGRALPEPSRYLRCP